MATKHVSAIRQLEGPCSVDFLVPTERLNALLGRTAPDLLLLGDYHVGRGQCQKCDPAEGCYSLYNEMSLLKYVDEVSLHTGLRVDLFLEYWSPLDWSMNNAEHNSALTDVRVNTKHCRPGGTGDCPLRNIKVHMADVRFAHSFGKYRGDLLYDIYTTEQSFSRYCSEHFPEYPVSYLSRLVRDYFRIDAKADAILERFMTDPFFQKYSRIHHELQQVPAGVRDDLARRFILPMTVKQMQQKIDYVKYDANPPHEFVPMCESSMMNIYALSRLLRDSKGEAKAEAEAEAETQFGIFYMGAKHVQDIARGLIELGYYESLGEYGLNFGPDQMRFMRDLLSSLGGLEEVSAHIDGHKCIQNISWNIH